MVFVHAIFVFMLLNKIHRYPFTLKTFKYHEKNDYAYIFLGTDSEEDIKFYFYSSITMQGMRY